MKVEMVSVHVVHPFSLSRANSVGLGTCKSWSRNDDRLESQS